MFEQVVGNSEHMLLYSMVGPCSVFNQVGYTWRCITHMFLNRNTGLPAGCIRFTNYTAVHLCDGFFQSAANMRPLMRRNPCV
jgi:hypothetical protein